ncbi:TonB-dependent receptor [Nitrogeniibacter mangrovi]|uniref:TonB-dependent receptor n=1 Tax=Nitrogeniibacter mangrovi TaxID=2016596 RepID=A0A6C1AY66_9RHOO|nr:TonB-dependent receptor [Nitrogeniibacter mangrovi]QID16302.1 TonB-dependent receptor [Nitrogeniibacter mangrovi]
MSRHHDSPLFPRRHGLALLATLALSTASPSLRAADSFEEDAYFEPLPVVLTASRLPQPLQDAPGAMTVIDRDLIDATGYRNIPRLLRFVPGMHIGYERGHATWVSYHGLGLATAGEMQVLVDGAIIYVPTNFGTIDWSGVPIFMSEIERVEVIRGASANSLGSSALLGTVNLITRAPAESPGTHVQFNLGDPSIRDAEVGWSGRIGEVAMKLTAGEQHDEGFRGLHDTRTTQRFSVRADTRIDAENSLLVRLGGATEQLQRGYPDSPLDNNDVRTAEDRNHLLHVRWQRVIDADHEWSLSAYIHQTDYNDDWIADASSLAALLALPPSTLRNVPVSRDREGLLTSLDFQLRDRLSPQLRGVWGLSASEDRTDSPASFYNRGTIVDRHHRVFGNLEWQPAEDWSFNLGLAAEDRGTGWRLSPRLYGSYHARKGTTLRLGVSRAWRNPTMFERYGDVRVFTTSGALLANPYAPNPDLQPTRADTLEAGIIQQFETARSTLDLRIFKERLKELTVREPIADQPGLNPLLTSLVPTTQMQNAKDPLTLTGLEIQFETHPWRAGTVRLAYSVIDRDAADPAIRSGIAPYSANLSWRQRWPGRWTSFLGVTRIGPVTSGDSFVASGRYLVKDFTTYDLSVSRPLELLGHKARFQLSALNLGPRHQEIADPAMQTVYGSTPANRVSRQVYAGLSLRF